MKRSDLKPVNQFLSSSGFYIGSVYSDFPKLPQGLHVFAEGSYRLGCLQQSNQRAPQFMLRKGHKLEADQLLDENRVYDASELGFTEEDMALIHLQTEPIKDLLFFDY